MSKRADCRKCVFFVPAERLDDDTRERALIWIEKWRPGARLLGWCRAYGRPVTYYTGTCYRYRPRSPAPPAKKSILEYLGGGKG